VLLRWIDGSPVQEGQYTFTPTTTSLNYDSWAANKALLQWDAVGKFRLQDIVLKAGKSSLTGTAVKLGYVKSDKS
jgi:hypothetical protein